jgi:hypothetical protein
MTAAKTPDSRERPAPDEQKAAMMTVDSYMSRNNKGCEFFPDMWFNADAIANRYYVPAITMDQAFDFMGEDDEANVGKDISPMLSWQKLYHITRSQTETNRIARNGDLIILYECACDVEKKLRHHPDYSKPAEVMLLCRKCHAQEHKRIRANR